MLEKTLDWLYIMHNLLSDRIHALGACGMPAEILSWLVVAIHTFTNRQLALGTWSLLFIIYIFLYKKTRLPAFNVIRLSLNPKFIIMYIIMGLYTCAIVYLLHFIGFWDTSLLAKTIMWVLFTGIVSVFRAIEKAKDIGYFKTIFKDYVKIAIVLEFIVNKYTFSYFAEFILMLIIFFVTACKTMLAILPEYQNAKSEPVKKLFNWLNFALGSCIILNAIVLFALDFENLGTLGNLRKLLLSPVLSIAFIGCVYLFALWSSYEQVFIRIGFGTLKSKRLITYIKIKIVLLCRLDLGKVNRFWRICGVNVLNISNVDETVEVFNSCKKLMQES